MATITDKELLEKLIQQEDFLRSEVSEYQSGKTHFAYKIAATLRTIFHKTTMSSPILPDLANKYGCPFMLRGRIPPKNAILYLGFVFGTNKDPAIILSAPTLVPMTFADCWNSVVYIDPVAAYTRSQLVLWAANKLGGAHVDPKIPPKLVHLVGSEGPRLVSQAYGEETIINPVVYEMALFVLEALKTLIPCLKSKIT
jgi:hypothetical protein